MKSKNSLSLLVEFSITCLLILLSNFNHLFVCILVFWIIGMSIGKIVRTKNNTLLVLELFMLYYAFTPAVYFLFGIQICPYQRYDLDQYNNMLAVTQIQGFFISIFLNIIPIQSTLSFSDIIVIKKRDIVWLVTTMVMIATFLLVDWRSIYTSFLRNGYTLERTGDILIDYFAIFGLVNYMFSDTNRKKRVNFILITVMAFASLLTGARASAVCYGVLLFMLYFDQKVSKRMAISVFVVGTIFLNSFQYLRTFSLPSIENVFLGDYNAATNIMRNNQGDVWYATEAIYKLIHNGVFDFTFRMRSFIGTILNSFLTTSLTPPEAIVNRYIVDNKLIAYPNNGGLIGVTTYLWFGYAGTFLAALILGKLIANGFDKKSTGVVMVSILVLITLPRWYTYNPRIIFKFLFVGLVYYLFSKCVEYMTMRKR